MLGRWRRQAATGGGRWWRLCTRDKGHGPESNQGASINTVFYFFQILTFLEVEDAVKWRKTALEFHPSPVFPIPISEDYIMSVVTTILIRNGESAKLPWSRGSVLLSGLL